MDSNFRRGLITLSKAPALEAVASSVNLHYSTAKWGTYFRYKLAELYLPLRDVFLYRRLVVE